MPPRVDTDTAETYQRVLHILNPSTPLAASCDLPQLTDAFRALDSQLEDGSRTAAQKQVVDQLAKAIGRVVSFPELTVQDAIHKTWQEREQTARSRLNAK